MIKFDSKHMWLCILVSSLATRSHSRKDCCFAAVIFHALSLFLWWSRRTHLRLSRRLNELLLSVVVAAWVPTHCQWLVSDFRWRMVVAAVNHVIRLNLLLRVPINVIIAWVVAMHRMLELADDILLISGGSSWSWTCTHHVLLMDLVVTVEGCDRADSDCILQTLVDNLRLMLLLGHFLI